MLGNLRRPAFTENTQTRLSIPQSKSLRAHFPILMADVNVKLHLHDLMHWMIARMSSCPGVPNKMLSSKVQSSENFDAR